MSFVIVREADPCLGLIELRRQRKRETERVKEKERKRERVGERRVRCEVKKGKEC